MGNTKQEADRSLSALLDRMLTAGIRHLEESVEQTTQPDHLLDLIDQLSHLRQLQHGKEKVDKFTEVLKKVDRQTAQTMVREEMPNLRREVQSLIAVWESLSKKLELELKE